LAGELILASASPRRRAILTQLGVRFRAVTVAVDEVEQGDAHEVARGNAARKARAALAGARPADTVLAADTVVALDGRLLPKPRDAGQAREWLRSLSGREHLVVSAVWVARDQSERGAASATLVRFRSLTEAEVDWYLGTAEWRGKAGGYAIQGRGAALVAGISGDYWTVVGLPVPALVDLLGPELLTGS
jgi:nucleoside triphosphate pyrophosphatase